MIVIRKINENRTVTEFTNLIGVLNKFKGHKIFIDIDVPIEEFKKIRNYTRLTKGKVYNATVEIYNSEVGNYIIEITDQNTIDKEIKTFLETEYFINYKMEFDIPVMLNYGVKLNIKDDIRILYNLNESFENRTPREERIIAETKIDKKELSKNLKNVELIYNKYLNEFGDNEYKNSFEINKQFVYAGYFGVTTDLTNENQQKLLYEIEQTKQEIKDVYLKEHKLNIDSSKELKQYTQNNINPEEPSNNVKTLKWKYPEHEEFFQGIQKYIHYSKLIKYLKGNPKMRLRLTKDYEIQGISDLFVVHCANSQLINYATNPSKEYYISIESGIQNRYKYLEKEYNNTILDKNIDYHKYTASILFDKPLDEVSRQERTEAKKFNFYRFLAGNTELKGMSFYKTFDKNEIKIIDKMYNLNRERLKNIRGKDILNINKIIYDKLAAMCNTLNNREDFSIKLSFVNYGDQYIFKISNNINPYCVIKTLSDALDTTDIIGFRLFDTYSIGNNLKELKDNTEKLEMTHERIEELNKEKGKIAFRNIVKEVETEFNGSSQKPATFTVK